MSKKKDKILEIIETSGGDLPHEVAEVFKSQGWEAQIGPHYIDVASGKTREIDLIVRKNIDITDHFWNNVREKLLIRIFIECKNISSECLIHFTKRNREKALKLIKENSVFRNEKYADFSKHHYLVDADVAKTWNLKGRDDFFDAWSQSVHSLIYFGNKYENNYTLDFPLVVLKSFNNLYKREKTEEKYSRLIENFQLEVDYSYPLKDRDLTRTFLVDYVNFDNLASFLKILEEDIKIAERAVLDKISEEAYANRMYEQQRNRDQDWR